MDDKIYKVTLADGTVLDNLRMNGNNFISQTPVDPSVFDGNCSPIIINDGSNDEIHDDMALVQVTQSGNEHWFVLRDIPANELASMKMRSDLEYLAMMAGVEL